MLSLNKHSINASIAERYASICYEFEFENKSDVNGSNELKFAITIDAQAFICGFSANIDGELFIGETKEKKKAKKEYVAAKEKNENAILISQPYPDIANVFEIKTNIDSKSKIILKIQIEQYLQKKFNFNELSIEILKEFYKYNINKNYEAISFNVEIADKRGIYEIQLPANNELEIVIETNIMNKNNTLCIITGKMARNCKLNEFTLKYKIKGEQNESNILYDKKSKTFVHVISDIISDSTINEMTAQNIAAAEGDTDSKEMAMIPRRVIFVVDKSGSMSGNKWDKTISATITALKQLRIGYDRYGVIFFDDQLEFCPNVGTLLADKSNVAESIAYVQQQQTGGSTDINLALLKGIDLIKSDIKLMDETPEYNFFMNQLVLITDGEPNSGVTSTNTIISNVMRENKVNQISIFCFGVGSDQNDSSWTQDLNHSFLKLLALNNDGIYKRIKESKCETQLNEYFDVLSKPVLSNINIKYEGIDGMDLTKTCFNTLYAGNDIIICGQLKNDKVLTMTANISAMTGKQSNVKMVVKPIEINKKIKVSLNEMDDEKEKDDDKEKDNVERIWAYLKLKQFAENKLISNDMIEYDEDEHCEHIALALALKYKFVTPWTSMIVVKHKLQQNEQQQGSFNNNPNNNFRGGGVPPPRMMGPPMMNGAMLNMMNGSMLNMNMNNPPPNMNMNMNMNMNNMNNMNNINMNNMQNNMQQRQGNFYQPDPNFAMNVPINAPMNPPMNILQQMANSGSFYGAPAPRGGPSNNMFASMGNINNINNMRPAPGPGPGPPPPPQPNGARPPQPMAANYQYDQSLQHKKKKKRKKKKKKKRKLGGNIAISVCPADAGDGDYSLSAPRPRSGSRQKVTGRIRNSFLMTSHSQQALPIMGKQIGFSAKKAPQSQHYSEKRKKKVKYSRKETDKMKAKLKLISSEKNMKKLGAIKDKKTQNKLIMKKIHLCEYVCDFRAAGTGIITLDKAEKARIENKYNLLLELKEHLHRSDWHDTMGADLYKFLESLFKMLSHNLFRVLPDGFIVETINTNTTGKDVQVTVSKELPAWKHLELIYAIFETVLLKMKADSHAGKAMVVECLESFNVISNMVYLLNSEEVREEERIAAILGILYKHYALCRLSLLGQLSNVCYSYLYINNRDLNIGRTLTEKNKTQREYSKQLAFGVKTALQIFRECLQNLENNDEMDGWVELLCKVIIPLHKAIIDEFTIFDDALGQISVTFCEKYFLSFIYIFQGMLRYWPVTSSKKEQLFLHRIGPLLGMADEDVWEFKDKSQCEFRDVFTNLSHKIVDSMQNYQHTHYATAEMVYDMMEDDCLQRFLDIYGGKHCWIKLYKAMHDIKTKFFWKETIDKTVDFMENCREEDDIPMQYLEEFDAIDADKYDKYPSGEVNEYTIEEERLRQKRMERERYYSFLNKKYQKQNIAKYQKHVYKNNQPMLQLEKEERHSSLNPSINWNSTAMKALTESMEHLDKIDGKVAKIEGLLNKNKNKNKNNKSKLKRKSKNKNKKHKIQKRKPSTKKNKPLPLKAKKNKNVNSGLPPPQIWDDDDF